MFHALMLAAFADGLVERIIVGRRAELGDIARTEAADDFWIKLNFAGRYQGNIRQRAGGALAFSIEAADGIERVPEHVEPDGLIETRREDVDDATAHGKFAWLAHCACAAVAIGNEIGRQRIEIDDIADMGAPG